MVITVLSGGVGAARLLARAERRRRSERDHRGRERRRRPRPARTHDLSRPRHDHVHPGRTQQRRTRLGAARRDVAGHGRARASSGGEAWFRLGDRDLATHLYRSQRLEPGRHQDRGRRTNSLDDSACAVTLVTGHRRPDRDGVRDRRGTTQLSGVLRASPPRRRGRGDRDRRRRQDATQRRRRRSRTARRVSES